MNSPVGQCCFFCQKKGNPSSSNFLFIKKRNRVHFFQISLQGAPSFYGQTVTIQTCQGPADVLGTSRLDGKSEGLNGWVSSKAWQKIVGFVA